MLAKGVSLYLEGDANDYVGKVDTFFFYLILFPNFFYSVSFSGDLCMKSLEANALKSYPTLTKGLFKIFRNSKRKSGAEMVEKFHFHRLIILRGVDSLGSTFWFRVSLRYLKFVLST